MRLLGFLFRLRHLGAVGRVVCGLPFVKFKNKKKIKETN